MERDNNRESRNSKCLSETGSQGLCSKIMKGKTGKKREDKVG